MTVRNCTLSSQINPSFLADVQQDASRSSAAHEVQCVVDLIQREFIGDDAIIIDPAGLGEPNQPRDVAGRLALPTFGAFQHLSKCSGSV